MRQRLSRAAAKPSGSPRDSVHRFMDLPTSIFKLTFYQPPSGAREDKLQPLLS